jgi:hypothetical protein
VVHEGSTTLVVSAYLPSAGLMFNVRPNQHLSYKMLILVLLFESSAGTVTASKTETHSAFHSCTIKEQSERETRAPEDDGN